MASPLTYIEHRPPVDLAPWVACFWEISGRVDAAAPVSHRVLPDGCIDLLFDLEAARTSGGVSAEVIGPMSRAQVFPLQGVVDVLGVRLRPGAIAAFGGIVASLLLDTTASLSELRPAFCINVAELVDRADSRVRIGLVARACRKRVAGLGRPDSVIRAALIQWSSAQSSHFPTISVLTRDVGLSERAFERRFVSQVGITPVRYRRLARFRTVLRLYAGGQRNWSALAAATGFSDQSHLVRDCREFVGLTPREWAASQADRAGFIQDGEVTTL